MTTNPPSPLSSPIQYSPSPPISKTKPPSSSLRPLSPHRHLRTNSSPASTSSGVVSRYPRSMGQGSLKRWGSLMGEGSEGGSPIEGIKRDATPPSHLPLPHFALLNLGVERSIQRQRNKSENTNPSIPSYSSPPSNNPPTPQTQPSQTSTQTTQTNNPNNPTTRYTTSTPPAQSQGTNNKTNTNPPKKKEKKKNNKKSSLNFAALLLFSFHILLVSVLVICWFNRWSLPLAESEYGSHGDTTMAEVVDVDGGFADLRAWVGFDFDSYSEVNREVDEEIGMDGNGEIDGSIDIDMRGEIEALFLGRCGDVDGGDGSSEDWKIEDWEEDGEGEDEEEYGEGGLVVGEGEEVVKEMGETKFTLQTVLEELGMGRLREARL